MFLLLNFLEFLEIGWEVLTWFLSFKTTHTQILTIAQSCSPNQSTSPARRPRVGKWERPQPQSDIPSDLVVHHVDGKAVNGDCGLTIWATGSIWPRCGQMRRLFAVEYCLTGSMFVVLQSYVTVELRKWNRTICVNLFKKRGVALFRHWKLIPQ